MWGERERFYFFKSDSSVNFIDLHSEIVRYPLYLREPKSIQLHALVPFFPVSKTQEEKGDDRRRPYNEILSHALELVTDVVVVRLVPPFAFEEVESLLQDRERSDRGRIGQLSRRKKRKRKLSVSTRASDGRKAHARATHGCQPQIRFLEFRARSDDRMLVPIDHVLIGESETRLVPLERVKKEEKKNASLRDDQNLRDRTRPLNRGSRCHCTARRSALLPVRACLGIQTPPPLPQQESRCSAPRNVSRASPSVRPLESFAVEG